MPSNSCCTGGSTGRHATPCRLGSPDERFTPDHRQVRGLRVRDGATDRVLVLYFRSVPHRFDNGLFRALRRRVAPEDRTDGARRRYSGGHRQGDQVGTRQEVLVTFDADRGVVLSNGTRAVVRYLNLVGDRYLELVDGPGSTRVLPGGAQIPVDRTAPALDLDLLLGGLKPVITGLNPHD